MPTQTYRHAQLADIKQRKSWNSNQQLTNNGDTRARIALHWPDPLCWLQWGNITTETQSHLSTQLETANTEQAKETQSPVQCHGHQRNSWTEARRVFPAPPGVREPQCPRHRTKTHRSSNSEQLLPLQVNHSVVFPTWTQKSLIASPASGNESWGGGRDPSDSPRKSKWLSPWTDRCRIKVDVPRSWSPPRGLIRPSAIGK